MKHDRLFNGFFVVVFIAVLAFWGLAIVAGYKIGHHYRWW